MLHQELDVLIRFKSISVLTEEEMKEIHEILTKNLQQMLLDRVFSSDILGGTVIINNHKKGFG